MQIVRVVVAFIVFISIGIKAHSQTDTCNLRISLLTCSPGEELYSTFGHTAVRVTDSSTGMDMVFNYGTFDDSDPNFYLNFTKGLMNYALSAYPFADFVYEYQSEHRGVVEQVLSLSCAEKNKLFNALRENAQEKNRFYGYYFHTDNCTTRARDIIRRNTDNPVNFRNILPANTPSYRDLIHSYLDKGHQPWSKFGIDILLGSNLDKKLSNEQAMFLPDYLLKAFDSATADNKPLVGATATILPTPPSTETGSWFTPFVLFAALFVIVALLSFSKSTTATRLVRGFDVVFFLLLGLLGLLLATLWIIRVDDVCRSNWNLLWSLPTHLPVVFVMNRGKQWVKTYFKAVAIITILLAGTWFVLPQTLNPAIAPILAIILVRAWCRRK
ncbi:DUF4105 domain-containing protein [Paraflavitalea sp. CAU 1676]|uniref:Lnb N-terminal periplasmic domain-containing protein n=1 Tax=Paraflavitalea sp. CAU 1676 TaxID=3032598 RepID=UPI0023DA6AA1|nr:DUF4105 domain-containing protein [Paraflavitalea sp. CAU 1676]MDF2192236.1 DUF4105 domain-containing protein [Paraflavitalea sp. CAU 1676]